ncbi:MAG: hypothetical protein IH868_10205 [Chloroflexi bacterium]|nr:hypothetical protein [Chloroflexota bacterium]
MSRPFTLIAHRGFSSRAPENTIAAFDLAIDAGFDNIELDAHLSADGVPVVIHDDALDRTTDGSGQVSSLTLPELRELDAGAWFGDDRAYAGAAVPTLDDVLERYAGRAHIHLELKSQDPDLPGVVIALLRKRGWLDLPRSDGGGGPFDAPGLTITSFQYEQLKRSIALTGSDVRHGWLVQEISGDVLQAAVDAGITAIYPRASNATTESTQMAEQAGMSVRGWSVGDESELLQIYRAGAAGTTVNWPDRALAILTGLYGDS